MPVVFSLSNTVVFVARRSLDVIYSFLNVIYLVAE